MKKILTTLALLVATTILLAQAPQKFSYQGVIRDAAGNLVRNAPVGVRVSLLKASADGVAVYCETHRQSTNANGLLTLTIGDGTVVGGDIAAIDWADGPYFLKTETDITGGSNYTLVGSQQLLSVPYALYAGNTTNAFSGESGQSGSGSDGKPCKGAATITDIDGNLYNTVQIGNQCWMKENLKTTKYADGSSISQGRSASTIVAYWYYPDNSSSNKATFGLLYNWKAVMRNASSSSAIPSGVQGVCPIGWHVPSADEWQSLINHVGHQIEIGQLANTTVAKALASTEGWGTSSSSGTPGYIPSANNFTSFSVVPAGLYYDYGDYRGLYHFFGNNADFWSATERNSFRAYYYDFNYESAGVDRNYYYNKSSGLSVRCLRDN